MFFCAIDTQSFLICPCDAAAPFHAALDDPFIIRYEGSFYDNNDLCIVTEFCDCGDLFGEIKARYAAQAYLSEREVLDVFVMIAAGLSHVHSQRILHR